jgi:hypothetical protein
VYLNICRVARISSDVRVISPRVTEPACSLVCRLVNTRVAHVSVAALSAVRAAQP